MSERGIDFMNGWVSENINAGIYPRKNYGRVKAHVEQCIADAKKVGIPVSEIEAGVGDIAEFIFEAMTEATTTEGNRLAAKDD